ncbi:helicase-related protein [Flavobacteriaceae bacterium]|nr:helicase-related protein [Flavobacteriaceae bacterium]
MITSKEEFLTKLKELDHWSQDIDYSIIKWINISSKVRVRYIPLNTFHELYPQKMISSNTQCVIKNAVDKSKFLKAELKRQYSNKYNLSNIKYEGYEVPVNLICPVSGHGEFQLTPRQIQRGIKQPCKRCNNLKSYSKENFIEDLKESGNYNEDIHSFDDLVYVNKKTKVIVINKLYNTKHEVSPDSFIKRGVTNIGNAIKSDKTNFLINDLINNYGRTLQNMNFEEFIYVDEKTKCVIINVGENKEGKVFNTKHLISPSQLKHKKTRCGLKNAISKEAFIKKSLSKNFIKEYDLTEIKYEGYDSTIKIICSEHGPFFQTVRNIIHKERGCTECRGGVKIDQKQAFEKINNKNFYFELTKDSVYVNSKTPITVKCKKYGTIHNVGYDSLISNVGPTFQNSQDPKKRFQVLGESIHGDLYDYNEVVYKDGETPVLIICKIHSEFYQTPRIHLSQGSGCPTCNKGWNTKRIISYINAIENKDILTMDPIELNMLIAQGKLPKELELLVFNSEGTGEHSLKSLKEKLGIDNNIENNEDELQRVSEEIEQLISSNNQEKTESLIAIDATPIEEPELPKIEEKDSKKLPNISNSDILVLDKELINTCDDEAVEFFIQYKLKKVWNEVINDKRDANEIKLLKGGKNSTRLRELFLEEYNKVLNYNPPKGYSFERNDKIAPPNMMQKLTVQRIKNYKRYGNWSGTGAGKTISFIIASREIESKLTIVICLNSTITQLKEDILEVYPDSLIHLGFREGQVFDRSKFNFLLVNYEKFQQGYTEEIFQDLNENNLVDFIVLDEIHNTKQRDKDESKRRGAVMRLIGRSAEMNPRFHLLGMSATPVINNLIEAKSLLQLITGKEYDDLNTRGTITNALKVFNQLLLNGIRYIPKYNIVLKELTGKNTNNLNIDGHSLIENLKANDSKDYLGLERTLLGPKLDSIKDYLKPKTILYTYFTDGSKIPQQIAKYVQAQGYSVGFYIGEQTKEDRETSKNSFVKGDTDVLIASRTIGTGVDGLQNVCNRMILLTLPWTDSEYTQLKGRIYRQGSKFGDVEIIIPQVYVDIDDQRWSWDKQRLQLIKDKRTLADAAVDGVIPSKHIPSREKLCSDSLQALKKWQERINEGKITIVSREDLILPLRPEIVEGLKSKLGDFSQLNYSWSVSKSENTFRRLKHDQSEWYYYHSLYAEKRKDWDEIPYKKIAEKINDRPDWIVADMGCGENLLSKEIKNKVHAFDYVALEGEDVIECDISNIPLENNTVDAVVFSLSLMGSNSEEYLQEGFRILKPYGTLFIAEPKTKYENKTESFRESLEKIGFKIMETKTTRRFLYIQGIKL